MDERRVDPDSRARTHLANERTLLAWLRTGVTFITVGLAAAQFLTRDVIPGLPVTRSLSISLVVGGVILALAGVRRYYVSSARIDAGTFRPTTLTAAFSAALFVALGALAIIFILLLHG